MNMRIGVTLSQRVRSCGNNCPPLRFKKICGHPIHSRTWIQQITSHFDEARKAKLWKQL